MDLYGLSPNAYQALAQAILRDFKLTRKIKTINGLQPSFIKTETRKNPNIVSESLI